MKNVIVNADMVSYGDFVLYPALANVALKETKGCNPHRAIAFNTTTPLSLTF